MTPDSQGCVFSALKVWPGLGVVCMCVSGEEEVLEIVCIGGDSIMGLM